MKAPAFWRERPPALAARLLQPIGAIQGAATLARMRRAGRRLGTPVICVGNFTAGGAGKTPTALALVRALCVRGETPAFLTRGYGGGVRSPLVADLARHDAGMIGDEALLLARLAPTVVSPDRLAGAEAALGLKPSLIVMDDGMQNPALAKDFTVAVVDAGAGFGNGLCLPAGPLRAPLAGQVACIDAVLTIGTGAGVAEAEALARNAGKPAFRSAFAVDPAAADRLAGRDVFAFAGIGRPEKFFETLRGVGARLAATAPFADHHAFSDAEARDLLETARRRGLTLATTEKDHVRLGGSPTLDRLAREAIPVPVRLDLPQGLVDAAAAAVSAVRRAGA